MNLLQASIAFNYVVKTNNQNITENAMKELNKMKTIAIIMAEEAQKDFQEKM